MSRQLNVLVFVLLGAGLTATSADRWSYEPWNEPSTWAETYPSCGGRRQSPIDLDDFTATSNPKMTWSGYGTAPPAMTLTNNGHSVSLTSKGVQPKITLNGGKVFQLDGVHFHWGRSNRGGSEHTLCGVRYALEMHAVHKRVSANGTIVSPMEIIVITSLFQHVSRRRSENLEEKRSTCSEKYSKIAQADRGLNRFVQLAPSVVHFNESTSVPPFAWSKLLYKFTDNFYWYEGSLTTPPCSEVVTFFVNRQVRWVTYYQLMFFRLLLNEESEPIASNNRRLQPRKGRKVYFYQGS